jgi:hypothetical protein
MKMKLCKHVPIGFFLKNISGLPALWHAGDFIFCGCLPFQCIDAPGLSTYSSVDGHGTVAQIACRERGCSDTGLQGSLVTEFVPSSGTLGMWSL